MTLWFSPDSHLGLPIHSIYLHSLWHVTHMWVLHQKLLPKSLGELIISVCDAACLIFGHFSSPQAFTLTPASYSHWTSTSLHSICFINPFHSFFKSFVVFFMSKRIFVVFTICKQYIFFFFCKCWKVSSKYHAATSKQQNGTWMGC